MMMLGLIGSPVKPFGSGAVASLGARSAVSLLSNPKSSFLDFSSRLNALKGCFLSGYNGFETFMLVYMVVYSVLYWFWRVLIVPASV